jgi:hypothetical protein
MITRVGRPRQSRCHRGHALSPANVRLIANGSQQCTVCARRRARDWARAQRAHQPIVDNKHPTIALVVWRFDGRDFRASWSYHRTPREASAQAPADAPFTVVDIARKPWIRHHTPGRGQPMTPTQLERLAAEIAARPKTMQPHPRGLEGRCEDAVADAELIAADPNASPAAKQHARRFADAMIAALAAERAH